MRLSRNILAAGAAIGLLAVAGTAVAQEHATRMIRVPANAVVLVLPPGAHVLSPGALEASAPMRYGSALGMDAMFGQMDAQMNAMMQAAQHQFAMPGTMAPGRTFQAMMRDMPPGAVQSVTVTSFSDGGQNCTQRVVYQGDGTAPVIQTSGDACGAMTPPAMPAAAPASVAPRQRGARLIEAAAHRVRTFRVAER